MKKIETLSFSWEFILIGLIFLIIGFLWIRQIYRPVIKPVPWWDSGNHLFLKRVANISLLITATLFVIWGSFASPSLELFRAEVLLFLAIALCVFISAMLPIVVITALDTVGWKEEIEKTPVWLMPFMAFLISGLIITFSFIFPKHDSILFVSSGGLMVGIGVFYIWKYLNGLRAPKETRKKMKNAHFV